MVLVAGRPSGGSLSGQMKREERVNLNERLFELGDHVFDAGDCFDLVGEGGLEELHEGSLGKATEDGENNTSHSPA